MTPLKRPIVMTDFDRKRLEGLLTFLRSRSGVDPWNLDALELELRRAEIVPADAVPSDVVTMNSRVQLRDLQTDERFTVTLVFPRATPSDSSGVPVLSLLGLTLLGERAGNVLAWETDEGPRVLAIERIEYQPESAGHFFL